MDLPGVGSENGRNSPTSIGAIRIDIAKRFHDFIAQGKFPKGPWSVLGISLGGMIALDWATAEPDLFEKLIVINSSTSDVAKPLERFNIKLIPEILKVLMNPKPEFTEKMILKITSNRYQNKDPKILALLSEQIKWRRERPITRTTFLNQLYAGATYTLPPTRPKPKAVLFSSDGDRLVSPHCSSRMALQLGVRQIKHPWAGHDLVLDDPEWLANQIADWMITPV